MNRKRIPFIILIGLWLVVFLCQVSSSGEVATRLYWKNGDSLSGQLSASDSEPPNSEVHVHWSSPLFLDDLIIDIDALAKITFPESPASTSGAFRIGNVSGDVWTADLVAANNSTFLFSSQRFGRVRVNRDTVYSMNRRVNPNLIFDGSQLSAWGISLDAPIKNLVYKVFTGDWTWGDPFPDLLQLKPIDQGILTAGYLDLGLAEMEEHFAMSFEGQLEIEETGEYQFDLSADDAARLYIDGKQISGFNLKEEADDKQVEFMGNGRNLDIRLTKGRHSLRVEYLDYGGEARLSLSIMTPNRNKVSLVKENKSSIWQNAPGGHPMTSRAQAKIFRPLQLLDRFAVELEFISTGQPRFVFALGEDLEQVLRLETWGNELVVVQDTVFEPVLTIDEEQHDLRLRLVFDSQTNELQVYDITGQLLIEIDQVSIIAEGLGIYIHNRGSDLTLQRLSVYHQTSEVSQGPIDPTRSRIYLIDGQVIYGRLFMTDGQAYVIAENQQRQDIDLTQLDRIASTGVRLAINTANSYLVYNNGALIKGEIQEVQPDQVTLRTDFSNEPVVCELTGLESIQFPVNEIEYEPDNPVDDLLRLESSVLRGELTFDTSSTPLNWLPAGATKSLALTNHVSAIIDRNRSVLKPGLPFNVLEFPSLLHLKNGEVIPCAVISYNEDELSFKSPFIIGTTIESKQVKAIHFNPARELNYDELNTTTSGLFGWLDTILGAIERETNVPLIDPIKLERALTVPRFKRDSPPSHVLVAKTGDLMRGSLLEIRGQMIQFDSKLRTVSLPVNRIMQVVDVSSPEESGVDKQKDQLETRPDSKAKVVRVDLSDGSILIFEPLTTAEGQLLGNSPFYGEMTIPIETIQRLTVGEFEEDNFDSLFAEWVVRPGKEPEFGEEKLSP